MEYKFSDSGIYYCPEVDCQEEFLDYLRELPMAPSPEAFGLHENCNITCAQGETAELLEGMLEMAPKSSSGAGASAEEIMDKAAAGIMDQTPTPFDYDYVEENFPTLYE